MNLDIQQKIDELVAVVRAVSPATAVSFELFVNASEYEAEFSYRDAVSLTAGGMAMRGLNGKFIK